MGQNLPTFQGANQSNIFFKENKKRKDFICWKVQNGPRRMAALPCMAGEIRFGILLAAFP